MNKEIKINILQYFEQLSSSAYNFKDASSIWELIDIIRNLVWP